MQNFSSTVNMKILVVEECDERRADLVDVLCELPRIEVRGATANAAETGWRLTGERIDAVVLGRVADADRDAIAALTDSHDCALLDAGPDVIGTLTALAEERRQRYGRTFASLAARSKYLALDRGSPETIVLDEWLPKVIARVRPLLSELVEVVVIVAPDTQPVCCVSDALEHVVIDIVVQACKSLPWGGIVWLTATPGGDGEVKLDVLENGGGRVQDFTLLASPSMTR